MRLKTYVINLEKSSVRRQYMQDLLAVYDFLDVEFIKAIDGRVLSEEERSLRFDLAKSKKLYGKLLNAGEVGCVLSHRKVYEELLSISDYDYALVFEDDISIIRDLHSLDLPGIDKVMKSDKPRVLMLSGDYCYFRKRSIVRLYSAVGAYAYMINKAAAKTILSITPPCYVADDWIFLKRKRLKLYAVLPYMVDANTNMELLGSEVKQDSWGINRSGMSLKENIIRVFTGFTERMFRLFNHFEYKVRIYNNNIVEPLKNPFNF